MFEPPTKEDIGRALSTLMHDAHHKLLTARNHATARAAQAGALRSNRLIITVAGEAEKIHVEAMKQATSMLQEFVQRMDVAPSQVTECARPYLEKLGSGFLERFIQVAFPPTTSALSRSTKPNSTNAWRARFAMSRLASAERVDSWVCQSKTNGSGRQRRSQCSNRS
jgi:hypothetical protein